MNGYVDLHCRPYVRITYNMLSTYITTNTQRFKQDRQLSLQLMTVGTATVGNTTTWFHPQVGLGDYPQTPRNTAGCVQAIGNVVTRSPAAYLTTS